MSKRLNTLLTSAIAGGAILLTACGQAGPGNAAGTPTSTSATTVATSPPRGTASGGQSLTSATVTTKARTGESELQPANCGPVKLPTGATHNLVAAATANGRVGCTEAFNVFDEFVKLPAEKHAEASLGNVRLSNGWSCTIDDGEVAAASCTQGEHRLSFHTEPKPA
ncbi:MAG: hypothetical protein ABW215_17065 [Kibdelosporangium sp.]